METRTSHNWKTTPGYFDVLNTFRIFSSNNDYDIPDLDLDIPDKPVNLIPFNHRIRSDKGYRGLAIHFFLDDYRFEPVWIRPNQALKRLSEASSVLAPDFSVYEDWPEPLQIYNVYRSRWISRYWQSNGIRVIPTLQWSDKKSYRYCFEGIPQGMPIAISTVSIDDTNLDDFLNGFFTGYEKINPEYIVCYGTKDIGSQDFHRIPNIIYYPTYWGGLRSGRVHNGRTWQEIQEAKAKIRKGKETASIGVF